MTERKIKAGVVGVGSLGQHHARVYSELAETELVGVYDVNPEQAREVAARHGVKAFDSLDAFANEVEAASIAVPTDRHHEIAGLLLDRGMHLLVEKPITVTTAEAEDLVARAQAGKLILQVGHIERFNPVLSLLENRSGLPRFIESHRLSPYPPPRSGLPPRGTEVSVVLDLMIHDLEIILHLVNSPVKEIRAVGVPVLSRTEDIANVRLLFENSCVANITASRISPEKMRKIRVFLDDAYVSLDYQDQSGEIYGKTATGITREEVPVDKGEPLALELRAFAQCVMRHNEPVVSGEHAAEALKLAIEILHSIQKGAS